MGIKRIAKSNFNVSAWLGVDFLKDLTGKLLRHAESLGKFKQTGEKNNFEDVQEDLDLSERDIEQRTRHFHFVAWFSFLFAIGLILFSFLLMFEDKYLSAFISILLSFLVGAQSFRYSFWYFQMKQRRLGCTVREWLHFIFPRNG